MAHLPTHVNVLAHSFQPVPLLGKVMQVGEEPVTYLLGKVMQVGEEPVTYLLSSGAITHMSFCV